MTSTTHDLCGALSFLRTFELPGRHIVSQAANASMSEMGQTATFDTAWRCVWNAPMNRHSTPNVGKVAMIGPSHTGR